MADLLTECKKGLNLDLNSTAMDGLLNQKINIVKAFLKGGGVSDTTLNSDDAIGAIVVGVTDLWELEAGEIKFSPVFNVFAYQLAAGSEASTDA